MTRNYRMLPREHEQVLEVVGDWIRNVPFDDATGRPFTTMKQRDCAVAVQFGCRWGRLGPGQHLEYPATEQQKAEACEILRNRPLISDGFKRPTNTKLPGKGTVSPALPVATSELAGKMTPELEALAQPFRFLDLPAELRIRIYSFLIQGGCVFNVVPAERRPHCRARVYFTALTKIKPATCDVFHERVSSLFCVNRQIRNEGYSILYGKNSFLFHETGQPQGSMEFEGRQWDAFQMWTNVFWTDLSPLWPLTERTVPFVKDVTIVISPLDSRTEYSYTNILDRVQADTALLLHCKDLRSLQIVMSRQITREGHYRREDRPGHRFLVSVDDFGVLSVSARDKGREWTVPQERLQYILKPLASLHGVPSVSVTGLITSQFATLLASTMMSKELISLPPSPILDVTETVVRKRPGGGVKRRKVELPLRKYWEPMLDWTSVSGYTATLQDEL